MKKLTIAIFIVCLNINAAEQSVVHKKIIDHLSYLGYLAKINNGTIIVKHPTKPGFDIIQTRGGIVLRAWFKHKKNSLSQKTAYLELVNRINISSIVSKYTIDSQNDLVITACYPLPYYKESFSVFISAWETDFIKNSTAYAEELGKYIE
ncbi:MAG TPA: hypothetical protein P5123_00335 [Spirochaetota bacterium]|nr:hypothetical protein [Spirochaetota bacterium]